MKIVRKSMCNQATESIIDAAQQLMHDIESQRKQMHCISFETRAFSHTPSTTFALTRTTACVSGAKLRTALLECNDSASLRQTWRVHTRRAGGTEAGVV